MGTKKKGAPPAIAALDIGTEYAKALVVSVERDDDGATEAVA